MRYCSALLNHQPALVSSKYWDFIVILLASWTSNLVKIKDSTENSNVILLIVFGAATENYLALF